MLKNLKKWLQGTSQKQKSGRTADLRRSGAFESPAAEAANQDRSEPDPEVVEIDDELDGTVEDAGPGKNVLIRNKYVREETGTYETLKILDDSIVDSGEETGIDPYNTGDFDRSRNWDKRFRN